MQQGVEAYYEIEDFFFSLMSQQRLDFNGKGCAYVTGINAENLNPLMLRKNVLSNIDIILSNCKSLFPQQHLPWIAVIPFHEMTELLREKLEEKKLFFAEKTLAMGIKLDMYVPMLHNRKDILSMEGHLEEWFLPLIDAFGSERDITEQYRQCHKNALMKLQDNEYLRHFSFYKNDIPVSSLTLSLAKGVARIDDMGTLFTHQGFGYATLLLNHALAVAKEMGASACFLEAADREHSVYKKLGFETLFLNEIWRESKVRWV